MKILGKNIVFETKKKQKKDLVEEKEWLTNGQASIVQDAIVIIEMAYYDLYSTNMDRESIAKDLNKARELLQSMI